MVKMIQKVTADLTRLADGPSSGEHRSWRNNLRGLSVASQLVEEQARAIGVPDPWIDAAKHARDNGTRWEVGDSLPAAEAVDREQLLSRLHEQVEVLYDLSATHTACIDRFGAAPIELADRFREHLFLQCTRVGMVAAALDVTETEVQGWWFTDTDDWNSLLASTRELPASELLKRWRTHTKTAAVVDARVRVQALHMAGISLADASAHQVPPNPYDLVQAAEKAWRSGVTTSGTEHVPTAGAGSDDPVRDGDNAIDNAIRTALPDGPSGTWDNDSPESDAAPDSSTQTLPTTGPEP